MASRPDKTLVDNGGTPSDPSDDEFLKFLGVVKDDRNAHEYVGVYVTPGTPIGSCLDARNRRRVLWTRPKSTQPGDVFSPAKVQKGACKLALLPTPVTCLPGMQQGRPTSPTMMALRSQAW